MTRHLSLEDMQQRVGTLERRLANLESAYMELLAMLAPLGGNQLAALSMAPQRYEQNLRAQWWSSGGRTTHEAAQWRSSGTRLRAPR